MEQRDISLIKFNLSEIDIILDMYLEYIRCIKTILNLPPDKYKIKIDNVNTIKQYIAYMKETSDTNLTDLYLYYINVVRDSKIFYKCLVKLSYRPKQEKSMIEEWYISVRYMVLDINNILITYQLISEP